MKKILLALCVCAGLCACSSDDDLVSSTSTSDLDGTVAYLKVNLKDVNSSTRATDGGYAYGTEAEQAISNAYFYFYNADGSAAAKGSITSGITEGSSSPTTPSTMTDGNIEWNSDVVVAVWGIDNQWFPTQMLTILNKPTDIDLTGLSLTDATKVLAGTPYADANGNFVMSTSTYYASSTSGGSIVNTTALEKSNFAPEPINVTGDYTNGDYTAANVYVERLAAKVSVSDGIPEEDLTSIVFTGKSTPAVEITDNLSLEIASSDIARIAVLLDGWDINGTARDAYLSKQITADWASGAPFTGWNVAGDYRCYWAESPNYGDTDTDYPTSSNGNTDDDEADATKWLNPYLKYTSLENAKAFTSTTSTPYAYCGENTNTVGTNGVLKDSTSTGITNLLVKAQAVISSGGNNFSATDLVEYAGHIYTAADFCQKSVDDVVAYDMNALVSEVIAGLESSNETLAPYIEELNAAIYHDGIWVGEAVQNHKVTSSTKSSTVTLFDGSLLSLYNVGDGNVRMFYNMTTWPAWGSDGSQTIEDGLMDKYPASDIVYPTGDNIADLDNYEFYFHIDASKIDPTLTNLATLFGLIVTIGDESYLPIDNSYSFTTQNLGYEGHYGNHTYTLRNYFLRAITTEADDIDADFGSHYPNLYANGYMYYHVPIQHLNNPTNGNLGEGEYGIVRNHWYDITVNSISGLGRGIADQSEVIIPQPEITYYYLGADINILSWKHVQQTVNW